MSVIFKYSIPKYGCVEIPKGAMILSAQLQEDQPVLWAIVDPANEKENRFFFTAYTGQQFKETPTEILRNMYHIVTLQKINGIVIHVFEIINNWKPNAQVSDTTSDAMKNKS